MILDYCDKADVFGIDEAQFFDVAIVDVCRILANAGKRVVVAGLEKDYLANSFGPMPQIMVDAEYITKVNAICMNCGDQLISVTASAEKQNRWLWEKQINTKPYAGDVISIRWEKINEFY